MPRRTRSSPSKPKGPGRPHTYVGAWGELADKFESVQALAEALETSRRTLNHWALGDRTPPPLVQRAVNEFAREHGCSPPFPEPK